MEKAELDVTTALQQGLLSLKTRLKIAGDVANGLKAIHEARYIHQDIKADSILVSCQDKCTFSHKMIRIRESKARFKRCILHAPKQILILVDSNEYFRLI